MTGVRVQSEWEDPCQLGSRPPEGWGASAALPQQCLDMAFTAKSPRLSGCGFLAEGSQSCKLPLTLPCALTPCWCILQVITQRYQRLFSQSPSSEHHGFQAKQEKKKGERGFWGGLKQKTPNDKCWNPAEKLFNIDNLSMWDVLFSASSWHLKYL